MNGLKQYVAMVTKGKNAGALCTLTPLYALQTDDELACFPASHIITLSAYPSDPLAYVIDCGPEWGNPQAVGIGVKKYLEILGDL